MTKSIHRMGVEEAIRELKIPLVGENYRQREAKDVVVEALEQTLGQESILDKIRTEIKALEEGITSYHNDRPWIFKDEALEIIDKYKVEYTDRLEDEVEEESEEEMEIS